MKRVARQIAALALLLLLFCACHRWVTGNRYTSYVAMPRQTGETLSYRAEAEGAERLSVGGAEVRSAYVRVQIQPRQRGEASIRIVDTAGARVAGHSYRVGPLMTIYDPGTGGFTGDGVVLFAFTAFCLAVAFLMLRYFLRVRWTEFYSYGTIYAAGFSVFAGRPTTSRRSRPRWHWPLPWR